MRGRIAGAVAATAGRLTSPLPIDAYLGLVDPLWTTRSLRGRIESVRVETRRAATLQVRTGFGWPGHRAGQWLSVGVDIDGVRHQRPYSITSLPDPGSRRFTITVQAMAGGLVSNHLVHAAGPGTVLHLGDASG